MRQKGFTPILIAIILALIAVAGFLYISGTKGSILPIPTENPSSPETDNSIKVTQTDKWKTYTDIQNHFSFDFPISWKYEKNCNGSSASEEYFCISSPDLVVSPIGTVENGKRISVYTKSDGSLGVGYKPDEFCSTLKRESSVSCKQIQINKDVGIELTYSPDLGFKDIGVLKDDVIYLTFRASYSKDSKTSTLNSLSQILSSLKLNP